MSLFNIRTSMVCCYVRILTKKYGIRHIGCAMRKGVFGHMRTAKAQISLRIRAV